MKTESDDMMWTWIWAKSWDWGMWRVETDNFTVNLRIQWIHHFCILFLLFKVTWEFHSIFHEMVRAPLMRHMLLKCWTSIKNVPMSDSHDWRHLSQQIKRAANYWLWLCKTLSTETMMKMRDFPIEFPIDFSLFSRSVWFTYRHFRQHRYLVCVSTRW